MERGPGEHQHDIQQDEIDRLLVDAFMEDLRRGYRRTTLLGVGRRRTTYPVLLIDKIGSAAAGLRLLGLISDSRTDYLRKKTDGPGRQPRERAYFHPLLIIAQGDSATLGGMGPPNHRAEDRDGYSIADIKYYYREWYRALADSGRTWFIPLRVPTGDPPQGRRAELTEIRLPAAPQPVMGFVVAALFIAAASLTTFSTYHTHCGTWSWEPQLERHFLPAGRDQCVGLGSSKHRFFDNLGDVNGIDQKLAGELKDAEAKIYETNELAVKNPRYLTIVYLSQLTSLDVADYRSELGQLRGIVIAKEESMAAGLPVRVLLANGGYRMDDAATAAEAIATEARKDATLVAVMGLSISREGTRNAMLRLARSNPPIPMIGTVTSATDLATQTTKYYHQVGPANQQQADVIAFYTATRLDAKKATIYYRGDRRELFGNDLKGQAKRAFEARGIAVSEQPYRIDPGDDGDDINRAGRSACDVSPEGVVFYAGRAEQFPLFLDGMRNACQGHYPPVLGTVTRSVLDGKLNDFPGLTVDYVSAASSLAWGPDCTGAINSVSFFVNYRKLFGNDACANLRDGSSILAHDALLVFTQGVRNSGVDQPSPDAVLSGIEKIAGSGAIHGASGQIEYSSEQAIPKNKTVLVLRGKALMAPELLLLCGQLDGARPPQNNKCP